MIRCVALRKTYGATIAVSDLDLEVEAGEVFGFIGPNGAGKTTTIRMMVGILAPTSGTVVLGGYDIREAPEAAKAITGYVPDAPALYDKLTAWEFFRFTGELFHMPDARIEGNAQELIVRFHLVDFVNLPLESLSHGTRQRVAIVSALLHEPEVLVIDEPMVGLDPQHARVVKDVLKERSLAGMTVLVSTHQLSIAEEMSDRIGIINGGKLIAVGNRDELRQQSGNSGQLEEIFLSLTTGER